MGSIIRRRWVQYHGFHTVVFFSEKSYFGKSLVDLETEIENEMKRKNRKKRDGSKYQSSADTFRPYNFY